MKVEGREESLHICKFIRETLNNNLIKPEESKLTVSAGNKHYRNPDGATVAVNFLGNRDLISAMLYGSCQQF